MTAAAAGRARQTADAAGRGHRLWYLHADAADRVHRILQDLRFLRAAAVISHHGRSSRAADVQTMPARV